MLTTMYVDDGSDGLEYLVHAEVIFDEDGGYVTTVPVLDKNGKCIPATICLCNAHSPSECLCGCTTCDIIEDNDYD